jgi:hypothetical protein
MSLIGTQVRSFSQSLGVLLGVQRRFGFAQAVMLLDADSRVVDGVALTDPHRPTPDDAVESGIVIGSTHDVVQRALLLSAGVDGVVDLAEADLRRWRRYVDEFAAAGLELVDWLASDGQHIRSFAITTDAASAWVTT